MQNLSIFIWNIANPSPDRAAKQAEWIRKRKEDIFVLTEIKTSHGCLFLKKYFEAYGYYVLFPDIEDKEYGSMIVSKIPISGGTLKYMNFISSRAMCGKFSLFNKDIEVVGIYVPSRDTSDEKIKRKRFFLQTFLNAIQKLNPNNLRIVCGDFNILEPNHKPRYSFFKDWEYDFYSQLSQYQLSDAWRFLHPSKQEYSWVGKTGDGYRYDHCFVSNALLSVTKNSFYLHEPRLQKLSDHSALITKLSL